MDVQVRNESIMHKTCREQHEEERKLNEQAHATLCTHKSNLYKNNKCLLRRFLTSTCAVERKWKLLLPPHSGLSRAELSWSFQVLTVPAMLFEGNVKTPWVRRPDITGSDRRCVKKRGKGEEREVWTRREDGNGWIGNTWRAPTFVSWSKVQACRSGTKAYSDSNLHKRL